MTLERWLRAGQTVANESIPSYSGTPAASSGIEAAWAITRHSGPIVVYGTAEFLSHADPLLAVSCAGTSGERQDIILLDDAEPDAVHAQLPETLQKAVSEGRLHILQHTLSPLPSDLGAQIHNLVDRAVRDSSDITQQASRIASGIADLVAHQNMSRPIFHRRRRGDPARSLLISRTHSAMSGELLGRRIDHFVAQELAALRGAQGDPAWVAAPSYASRERYAQALQQLTDRRRRAAGAMA